MRNVVPNKDEAMDLAKKILNKIIAKAPIAVENVIKSVNAGYSFEHAGYAAESKYFAECSITEDFKEGTSAFLEKRAASFKGK